MSTCLIDNLRSSSDPGSLPASQEGPGPSQTQTPQANNIKTQQTGGGQGNNMDTQLGPVGL